MASSVASDTKSIITGLLTSSPTRCTIQHLCNDFVNTVGYKIPLRQLGFNNVEEYLRSIPDTVTVYGSGSHAEVQVVFKPKSAHINELVSKQRKNAIPNHKRKFIKSLPPQKQQSSMEQFNSRSNNNLSQNIQTTYNDYQSRIPKRIQNNLRKLILRFPDGISCIKLATEYNKMFQEKLTFDRYGYRSLIEMCSDLPEMFRFIQPTSDDFILYDRNKALPSINQNDKITPAEEGPKFSWELGPSLIPSDVFCLGDKIPHCLSEQHFQKGELLYICVGEIYNISNFWIYLTFTDLKVLTSEMQNFFHAQRNKYVIPDLLLEEGLYCACLYANEFHRTVIVDLLPKLPGYVRVFFIDYGTVGNVHSNHLWFLPKKFGKLPSQAMRANLWNLCPPNGSKCWSIQSINKFKESITNTALIAEIMNIGEKGLLEIYLADVTDENNIFYINDILVTQEHARYIQTIQSNEL